MESPVIFNHLLFIVRLEGITNAKNNGVKFGRPRIEKPQDFDIVVSRWKNKEIKSKEALCNCETLLLF